MSDLITTPQKNDLAINYSREQIDLIKNSYCKGTSDDELKLFLAVSQRLGLDVFARQIHAVKRWNSKLGKEVMTIQTSIDGYRSVAERTGCYAGSSLPIFDYDEKGKLISASITVKKIVKGLLCEFSAIAYMDEYMPTDGKNAMWNSRPKGMLSKCAESLALRKAFPLELSNVYTEDETEKDYVEQDHIDRAVNKAENTNYKNSNEQIAEIEKLCAEITAGMTKEQKAEWVIKNIGCPWRDLIKKPNNELAQIITKISSCKKQVVETTAEKIDTKSVPWD